jgi:uncharacterized protein (TIGR01777 family)
MTKVLIAGGSGALGSAIGAHFAKQGYQVIVLTRKLKADSPFEQVVWDGQAPAEAWGKELAESILINLAGELVDKIPTPENVALLESSRVLPTQALAAAATEYGKPALWLQMSTLAIYGDAGNIELTEISGESAEQVRARETQTAKLPQMIRVAKAWESALDSSCAKRVVVMRTGIVLQPNTPALNRLVTVTKRFLGGTVGSGIQWVSWIHIDDFLSALDFLVANKALAGVVHLSSPEPVTNRALMAALREALHRPWTPPTPPLFIKLGSRLLFKTDAQLALTGRRALPEKITAAGFAFRFSGIRGALADLLDR